MYIFKRYASEMRTNLEFHKQAEIDRVAHSDCSVIENIMLYYFLIVTIDHIKLKYEKLEAFIGSLGKYSRTLEKKKIWIGREK